VEAVVRALAVKGGLVPHCGHSVMVQRKAAFYAHPEGTGKSSDEKGRTI